jgi:hypothetical protein
MMIGLMEGARVRLVVPDNPRLDGALAVIISVETWGAHVTCPAAHTGHYRALWEEMVPLAAVTDAAAGPCDDCGSLNLLRTGTCWTCADCGKTGGC